MQCSICLFHILSHVPGDVNAVFYLVFSTGAVNAVVFLSGLFYLLSHVPRDVNAVFYLVFSTFCLMYLEM